MNPKKYKPDFSQLKGNELLKRGIIVALAGNYSVEFIGSPTLRELAEKAATTIGLVVDPPTTAQIVLAIETPTKQERQGKLPRTSTKDIITQASQSGSKPTRTDPDCNAPYGLWLKSLRPTLMEELRMWYVADTIAALGRSEETRPKHVVESINYMQSTVLYGRKYSLLPTIAKD